MIHRTIGCDISMCGMSLGAANYVQTPSREIVPSGVTCIRCRFDGRSIEALPDKKLIVAINGKTYEGCSVFIEEQDLDYKTLALKLPNAEKEALRSFYASYPRIKALHERFLNG